MAAVMQKIKGAGMPAEAMRTASYELRPEFDYANGKQTLRGYLARNAVEVRVDDLPSSAVLDVAVGAGATSVSGIRFDLKDRDRRRAGGAAAAVADARAQAETAAQAAGRESGARRTHRSAPRRACDASATADDDMRAEMSAAGAQPPMAPGELEVRRDGDDDGGRLDDVPRCRG